jgi:hypothetical protein
MLKILEVRFEDAARDDRLRAQGPGSIDSIGPWRHGTFLADAPFCKLFAAEGGNAGACAGIVGEMWGSDSSDFEQRMGRRLEGSTYLRRTPPAAVLAMRCPSFKTSVAF